MPSSYSEKDQLAAKTLRFLAVDAVQQANSGHPGLPLGVADMAIVLWTRFLKYNPHEPTWFNRDRFILSAGHGSAFLYSILHLSGYPMPLEEIKRFRQWGSLTPGHPERDVELGIETTTGPLGQGLGNAVGVALAERMLAAQFNQPGFPIVDHYTYAIASDGDLMEGVSHEAASLAGYLGLGKLIVLYDDNHISIDGPTELALTDDACARFTAYGWHVQRVDGHDMPAVEAALKAAQAETGRPSLIACRTHIGFGSPKQDTAGVHGSPLGEENVRKTKENLGWPPDAHFLIPDGVKEYFARYAERGVNASAEWEALFAKYHQVCPEQAKQLDLIIAGELPADWTSALPTFSPEKPLASRVASGKTLDAIAPHIPWLIGGSADLTPSNNTKTQGSEDIKPGDFHGKYIHYGVREHGMGAVMNGLALHGLRPYGGTFLIFSDYMRPAIRLAAFMGLPVVYVFTHDSIGLGEDGPTHQPVEHLTALRTIPNLVVIRPADANETAQAWKVALQRKDGPTALMLSRQDLPLLSPADNALAQGAYVLAGSSKEKTEVILIATGSEVSIAMTPREKLAEEGIGARVVSMPSWELFDAQPQEYQEAILTPGVPHVSIEAGVTLAWEHYLCTGGPKGKAIGLDHFGASAPYKELYKQFGFTVENVVEQVKKLL